MQEISGYPDVNTIGVKSWTTNTRPDSNPNQNMLLGYNTTTGSLELIGQNGAVTEILSDAIKKQIALLAHPVGEYYWTSNTNFNPNTAWGGTWQRIQDGRVLISNNSSHSVGSTGGSETVTLSLSQIPSHSHPHTHKHKHSRGTMNIKGTFAGGIDKNNSWSGAFYKISGIAGMADQDGTHYKTGFDASRNWSGYTSEDSTAASSHAAGGGGSHNNMQPYRTAICWHRTA